MKLQQKENTSILRVLEHNSQVHKAEMDNFNHPIAKLSQKTKSEFKETNKKINTVYNQTALLTEFRTKTNNKLDDVNEGIKNIRSDVNLANMTASKNKFDIEMIKNVINK